MSRRDDATVAWHEVPGERATPKDPSRRVRCDSCRCTHESDRERLWPYMDGLAKQNGTIPKCLGNVSDHLHLFNSQLQEMVHPIEPLSSSSNDIGHWDLLRPILPYPTGRFFRGRSPRHFVPGYDRIVPPGHFKQALAREEDLKIERDFAAKPGQNKSPTSSLIN